MLSILEAVAILVGGSLAILGFMLSGMGAEVWAWSRRIALSRLARKLTSGETVAGSRRGPSTPCSWKTVRPREECAEGPRTSKVDIETLERATVVAAGWLTSVLSASPVIRGNAM